MTHPTGSLRPKIRKFPSAFLVRFERPFSSLFLVFSSSSCIHKWGSTWVLRLEVLIYKFLPCQVIQVITWVHRSIAVPLRLSLWDQWRPVLKLTIWKIQNIPKHSKSFELSRSVRFRWDLDERAQPDQPIQWLPSSCQSAKRFCLSSNWWFHWNANCRLQATVRRGTFACLTLLVLERIPGQPVWVQTLNMQPFEYVYERICL